MEISINTKTKHTLEYASDVADQIVDLFKANDIKQPEAMMILTTMLLLFECEHEGSPFAAACSLAGMFLDDAKRIKNYEYDAIIEWCGEGELQ
jgi:hypothetical protein